MSTFHVAPVHLVADWDLLRLFQFERGEVPVEVQQQLIELLTPLFAEERGELQYVDDLRWQLQLPQKASIHTTPIDWATGGNLHKVMPQGEDALRWKQLLNETQMMLHDADVKQQSGQLVINGIWVWRDPSLLNRVQHWWSHRR
ncbi:MAG: hypothetical protein HON68_12305 [Gammaproteobacteria bacterium]|jgi:hypothetical protein|nr:hypothetical protein [Gammaproteobacteria bacterium]MBT3488380.1 hypothetical protein [Gammaproteobacteria bacterium]MBT3719429.1 hypothetical protein [Gammaproteobacteria bacterium]MBT3845586.1 hypothetical protein [Gammaproteobacteria bacterium]MBT3894116.1 hypothetical protein [Gammaproteobacteria bacterium]